MYTRTFLKRLYSVSQRGLTAAAAKVKKPPKYAYTSHLGVQRLVMSSLFPSPNQEGCSGGGGGGTVKDGKIVHPASRPILLPAQAMKIAQVPMCTMFETFLFPPTKEREREEKSSFSSPSCGRERVPRLYANTTTTCERERFAQKGTSFGLRRRPILSPPCSFSCGGKREGREGHGHASPLLLSPPSPDRSVSAGGGGRGKGGRGRFAALMAHPHPQPGGGEDASFISCV